MERLDTVSNILKKRKRVLDIKFSIQPLEASFNLGFLIGMISFNEFFDEVSQLPEEDAIFQLKEMTKELDDIIEKIDDKGIGGL